MTRDQTRSSQGIFPRPSSRPDPGPPTQGRRLRARRRSRLSPGSVPKPSENGPDELFSSHKEVSFVTVPVTVKDSDGKMVDGLLAKDFSVYEDGALAEAHVFHQRSLPIYRRP
jgi:hypothetical protein